MNIESREEAFPIFCLLFITFVGEREKKGHLFPLNIIHYICSLYFGYLLAQY